MVTLIMSKFSLVGAERGLPKQMARGLFATTWTMRLAECPPDAGRRDTRAAASSGFEPRGIFDDRRVCAEPAALQTWARRKANCPLLSADVYWNVLDAEGSQLAKFLKILALPRGLEPLFSP